MASKKYILVLAFVGLFQVASFAQKNDASDDWVFDSSKVSTRNLPQFNEFKNNQYPYPAKPRDQWELGLSAGLSGISGDVKGKAGFVGGVSLRKSLSHVFSLRAGYLGSFNSGDPNGFQAGYAKAYKSQTHDASLDLLVSLNTLSYYRGNPKTNIYLLVGSELIATQVKLKDPNGDYHIFYGVPGKPSQSGLISTFGGATINGRHGWSLLSGFSFGGGIAFKVSNTVNIGFEQRFTKAISGYDYLDGYKGGTSSDLISYSTLRLNLNVF